MHRTKALAACVAVLIVGLAPTASARPPESRTIHFSARFFAAGDRITGLGPCSQDPTHPYCSLRGEGIVYYRAPQAMTGFYFCYVYTDPLTLSPMNGECWNHVMGYLTGCGEGSFVAHHTDVRADSTGAGFDPAAGTWIRLTNKWTIVPGSGTGAFEDARGWGSDYADMKPDLSNTGVNTGHITCHV